MLPSDKRVNGCHATQNWDTWVRCKSWSRPNLHLYKCIRGSRRQVTLFVFSGKLWLAKCMKNLLFSPQIHFNFKPLGGELKPKFHNLGWESNQIRLCYIPVRKQCEIEIARKTAQEKAVFDTDPDPRIRTTGLRIRTRIQLFSSGAFKMPIKNRILFWPIS